MIGLSKGIESRAWLGFAAVVVAGIVIGWLVYASVTRVQEDRDAVARTNQTLGTINDAFAALQEVEADQRGYVITASPDYLAQLDDGEQALHENLARLKTLLSRDPLQQGRVEALDALASRETIFAREAVATRDTAGEGAAGQLIASGRGKALMDEARALVREMQQTESDRLAQRNDSSDAATRNSTILMLALAITSLGLFGSLLVAITRTLASQRRAAEAAANLSAIVGASSDAVIGLDLDGRIVSWNPGAERLFGYTASEAQGQHVSLIVPPDQSYVQEANLQVVREGGQIVGQETVRLGKDGRRVEVSLSAFPIVDSTGGLTGFGGVFRDVTERRQAEEALRESRERWATIFHASPVALAITRLADSVLIDANRRYLDLFGLTRDEATGRTTVSLGVFDDLAQREAILDRLRTERAVREAEMRFRSRSGRRIDAVLSMEVVDLAGEPCVLSLIGDITARKQAEDERERVFTLSSDLVAVIGFDGSLRRVNPAVTEALGYAAGEIVGRAFLDLLHPDDRSSAVSEIARLQAGERSVTFQGRALAKDGSYRWVELVASADLETRLIYAVARDVTGRRAIEEALRVSEEQFRSIVVTATDAIIVADAAGNIELCNPAAEQMFGYAAAEMIGQNVKILVPPPFRDEHERVVAAFLETAESQPVGLDREMVGQRKDGSTFPHELTVNPMRIGDGIKFTAIIREISSRREMEDELRATKEAAEEANRSKSAFLSRMSHELRTPLNVVLGFGQVLQLDPLQPSQAEAVDYILGAGRHLLELIDEVLDISRIEAGRLSLAIEAVRADELLAETILLMRPLAEQRRVTVHSEYDSIAAFVLADRHRLKQVLLNLLSNAIKYNKEGGSVTIATRTEGDSILRIMVTDTGRGIEPEKLDRVFSPFDRLGAEAAGVEGTGLGLTLSRHLIEAMGGAIGVESAVGTGSTFWVELPFGAPPEESEPGTEAARQANLNPIDSGRSILYVEDNLANLKLMERLLTEQKGVHILAAMQGRLGIELARDHRPHLILLDLHLPDMLGSDVLRELKSHPATVDIPVVVISADASPGQAARLMEAGARAYLTKPLDLKQFLELTDSILREEG